MANTKNEIFNWQDYLDSNNSIDVPDTLFKHVEQSLDTGLSCGMAVEVPYKSSDETTHYWPAIVTKICGPMITLQYLGTKDKSKNCDIWSDIASLRNIGYSESIGIALTAPSCLLPLPKHLESEEALQNAIRNLPAVPLHVLEEEGKSAVYRISNGMVVGVRDILDPSIIQNAEIVNHVGGRLYLKTLTKPHDYFWLFYTDFRIVEPDTSTTSISFPLDLFLKHPKAERHSFEVGMQLEMLNPKTRASIHNGVVCEIIANNYFLAAIVDKNGDFEKERTHHNTWLCSQDHPYIFPVGWASKNNLQVIQTNDIDSERCTYKEMFSSRPNAQSLGFQVGMKMEAVHPNNENTICVATIQSIHEHLLCITFDHEVQNQLMKSYFVHCHSNEIFPIYWCGTNDYELVHPITEQGTNATNLVEDTCPIIYFNYKCRTGPMYSHKKISKLPVSVGPGVVSQVLKKVLNLIVSEAYQPLRILKSLECDGKPGPGRTLVEIKASTYNNLKEKVTVRANVDVVTSADQVPEYCQEICKIIQACPYLFGPLNTEDVCPENCTADKNGYSNDKVDSKRRKYGKRGLHLRAYHASRLARKSVQSKESEDSESTHISDIGSRPTTPISTASTEEPNLEEKTKSPTKVKETKRRKRKHDKTPPPQIYEKKTRGAKLPNFALQIKQGHWDKKDVETLYKTTLRIPKKKPRFEYITESESDASDAETVLNTNDNESDAKSNSDVSNTDISKNEDSNINEMSFHSINSSSTIDIKEENLCEEKLERENLDEKYLKQECLEVDNLKDENLDDKSLESENLDDESVEGENMEQEILHYENLSYENFDYESLDDDSLDAESSNEESSEDENMESENLEEVMSWNGSVSGKDEGPPLTSNPINWTVNEVQQYLQQTNCRDFATRLEEELVDGQAFMMLNLPFVQKYLNLKLDCAEKLCYHVARVKLAFFLEYFRAVPKSNMFSL